jgi:hypothetical protein
MVMCEHANEGSRGVCRCPDNCGCRERMCILQQSPRVIQLADRRPAPEFKWSPLEALEKLIDEIKTGVTSPKNLIVFYMEEGPDGRSSPVVWSSNMNIAESIGLAHLFIGRAIEEWRQ